MVTETVCAMCGGSGIIGNGPTSFNQKPCPCKQSYNHRTPDQMKQYEEAAKEYVKRQGTHDRPDITHHDFMSGCSHAHSKIEEAEREAWNRAIDEVEKWALSMWARNEHSIFTELKKLRK